MQYLTALSDNGNGVVSDPYATETKSYNTNGKLASLGFSGGVTGGIQYNYSATQNNGQITQAVDTISGETISYQYDRLKRLTSASSTPNTGSPTAAWNEAFQYDGFGNLTGKTLNGTAGAIPVNAATNQLANAYYDLNGNMTSGAGATLTYDESNRLTSAAEVSGGIEYYSYSPDNKQVWRQLPNGNAEYTVYGAHGEKLGVFAMVYSTAYANYSLTPIRSNIYFAGKMIWSDNVPAYQDRLGTNRANGARFYPFGGEITSTSNDREKFATYTRDSYTGLDYADQRYFASTYGRFNTPDPKFNSVNPNDPGTINRSTSNDREKFATYTRDSYTGLDYANQRYFASTYGRFNTPDPYKASASSKDPSSWNRYSYTRGDPVNRVDPKGLLDCDPDVCDWCDPTTDGRCDDGEDDGGGDYGAPQPQTLPPLPVVGLTTQNGFVRGSGNFSKAAEALYGAAADLSTLFQDAQSPQCEGDLSAVGVNDGQIAAAASNVTFLNGVRNPTNYAQGIYGNSPAFAANQQVYGATTIGKFFQLNPGTAALAQAPGQNVYIDSSWVNGMNPLQQEGLVLHELLHNITGKVDSVIQGNLGLPQNAPSQNIADLLQKDCLR